MPLAANVQGCSKDRQNEHAKKKKKKRMAVQGSTCHAEFCGGVSRWIQQQRTAIAKRALSTRHVSALSRNTNANRAEKQVADTTECHAPANFPFSAGLFLCRVLPLTSPPPFHHHLLIIAACRGMMKKNNKNRVQSGRSLRRALPAHCDSILRSSTQAGSEAAEPHDSGAWGDCGQHER